MKAALVAVLCIALTVAGCTTTRLVSPGAIAAGDVQQIHKGDHATILLKSGGILVANCGIKLDNCGN